MSNDLTEERPDDQTAPEQETAQETTEASSPEAETRPEDSAAPSVAGVPLTFGQASPFGDQAQELVIHNVRGKLDKSGIALGTGRRKTSVARVRVNRGTGQFVVNGRPLESYFSIERDRLKIAAPLRVTENEGKVDIWVRVEGGGTTGQAGAIILGIARALEALDPGNHRTLSDNGFLTRDSRMVERKKYGFKKARRSFQFSKR